MVFFRKLKAATVRSKAWATEDGLSAMIGWSHVRAPAGLHHILCDGLVGCPVLGPLHVDNDNRDLRDRRVSDVLLHK